MAGHIEAINNLGVMYDHGEGVPENNLEAVKLFEKAAKENLARAKTNLGLLYQRGEGVPQNLSIARKYFEEASAGGDYRGMTQLAVLLMAGGGGRKDPAQAKTLLETAALGGESRAAYQLALASPDKVEAYAWLNLAASEGDQPSIEMRNTLRAELSEEMLAAAEARSTQLAERKKS
jgi:TPR repeat protein